MPDHVATTIDTYDRIAPNYVLTAVPELRAWQEQSMTVLSSMLPGKRVLVPGCGDGRDSRFLASLGLSVLSTDLSSGMLREAKRSDPYGEYEILDLRDVAKLDESFDGIFASGCLYHLSKDEFTSFLRDANGILNPGGILYMSMKIGSGSHVLTTPGPDYPGGVASQQSLIGPRFYQYYQHQELLNLFLPHFNLLQWRDKEVQKEGVHEYWLAGD